MHVCWEIFELQNFQGYVDLLELSASKLLRIPIYVATVDKNGAKYFCVVKILG